MAIILVVHSWDFLKLYHDNSLYPVHFCGKKGPTPMLDDWETLFMANVTSLEISRGIRSICNSQKWDVKDRKCSYVLGKAEIEFFIKAFCFTEFIKGGK